MKWPLVRTGAMNKIFPEGIVFGCVFFFLFCMLADALSLKWLDGFQPSFHTRWKGELAWTLLKMGVVSLTVCQPSWKNTVFLLWVVYKQSPFQQLRSYQDRFPVRDTYGFWTHIGDNPGSFNHWAITLSQGFVHGGEWAPTGQDSKQQWATRIWDHHICAHSLLLIIMNWSFIDKRKTT